MQNSRSLFCAPFVVAPDNNNNNSNNIHSSYRKNNVTKKTAVAASKPTSCFELNRILLSIDFFPSLSEHSIFHKAFSLRSNGTLYVVCCQRERLQKKKMKEIEFMRAGRSLQWQNLWMWKHDNVTFHLRYKRSCCMFVSVAVFLFLQCCSSCAIT